MNVLARDPALVIADAWQRNFPLCQRPFAEVGNAHDLSETETIAALRRLAEHGILSRIGAVVRPNCAGASTLAAIAAPAKRLEEIAAIVSAEPYVNHNYERDHTINLWFVVAAPNEDELTTTLSRIERRTGLAVLDLRLQRPFHIDLGFSLAGDAPKHRHDDQSPRTASGDEKQLLAAMEDGLPWQAAPYAILAQRLGWPASRVSALIAGMLAAGIISRFGCVLRHRELGFTANAMAVWNIADDLVERVGVRMAALPSVTLCYRRNREMPDWPYNLFAMIHGRDEALVRTRIGEISEELDLDRSAHAILFSRRCFKQRGARFSSNGAGMRA